MDSNRTQDFIPIADIQNGMVLGKDGSAAVIIETSAVNFDLLSENEQMAIIGSFAGLLNSLSFSIQIVIRSKKLDISSYLEKLVEAEQKQDNPLLKKLMQNYRYFVSSVIRDNEVLDKQFFVVISVSSLELGILRSGNNEVFMQKALTTLTPRRDHIIRQLGRIGLKASQLSDEKLIKLFYDWYNEPVFETMDKQAKEDAAASSAAQAQSAPASTPTASSNPVSAPQASGPAPQPQSFSAPPQPTAAANANPGMSSSSSQPLTQPSTPLPNTSVGAGVSNTATTVNPSPVFPVQGPAQNPYPNTFPAQRINPSPSSVGTGQINRNGNTPFVVEELHD